MKIKLLIMLMSVLLLNTAAHASIISFTNGGLGAFDTFVNYSITGGSGDTWSGAFDVMLTGSANAGTVFTISENLTSSSFSLAFGGYGSSGSPNITWFSGGDSFSIDSSSLYTAVDTNGDTWNSILFGSDLGLGLGQYYISGASYNQGGGAVLLTNYSATPEPGTMLLLGSGVLTFGLSRFRRRKQEACA